MFKDDPVIAEKTPIITEESYAKGRKDNAVVLLDVNWGRKWGCAGYENAQIIAFAFDKIPADPRTKEAAADFTLKTPSRLSVKPTFINYAFLLAPGEYALSYTNIKAARSVSDVGYFIADRSMLFKDGMIGDRKIPLKDGKSHGSFRVDAGDTVYIGNFFIDCAIQPQLWRYYTEKENFSRHMNEYKKTYPFLDLDNVIYRLFDTEVFGQPYKPE